MKIILSILAVIVLVLVLLIIPLLIRMSACRECGRIEECEKLRKKGDLPPCMRNMPLSNTDMNL